MFKSFFSGSMKRLFLCIVLLCVIGIVVIGSYSWHVTSTVLFEQVEKTSLLQMQKANEEMKKLTEYIEDVVSKISTYKECYSKGDFKTVEEMNHYLSKAVDIESIGACFLRTSNGREYSYNPDSLYADAVQLHLFCNENIVGDGKLKWYNGDNENYVRRYENYYIVCTSVPEIENSYATLYLFVRKEMVENVLKYMQDKNNVVLILDKGKLLAVNDKQAWERITNNTLDILFQLYKTEIGFFEFQKINEKYITSFYQSPNSEFKFLAIYESQEFYEKNYNILNVMLLLTGFFSLLIIGLYRILRQNYIKPFGELVEEMKHTDGNSIGRYINIQGRGDISILVQQYNEMRDKISEMLEDVRRQEEMKRQAEVDALRYQINPHFFYNTLSNIKMLALKQGQKEISVTISKFANMYKYLFSNKSNFVKVSEEIGFIRNYVSLMNNRYDNRLNTFYLIDESSAECKLPIFLLQPIVENAIVHGLSKKLNERIECFLRIQIKCESNMLVIEIEDDGKGMSSEKIRRILSMKETDNKEFGLGLYNTIKRLKLQYGNQYEFRIDSVENMYTKIILTIPVEME